MDPKTNGCRYILTIIDDNGSEQISYHETYQDVEMHMILSTASLYNTEYRIDVWDPETNEYIEIDGGCL